jgi:hypothetical protein
MSCACYALILQHTVFIAGLAIALEIEIQVLSTTNKSLVNVFTPQLDDDFQAPKSIKRAFLAHQDLHFQVTCTSCTYFKLQPTTFSRSLKGIKNLRLP